MRYLRGKEDGIGATFTRHCADFNPSADTVMVVIPSFNPFVFSFYRPYGIAGRLLHNNDICEIVRIEQVFYTSLVMS